MTRGLIRAGAALLLLAFSLATAAGCAPKLPPEPAWEKDARELLEQADALFSRKQYEQSQKNVEAFLQRYPASRQQDRALYLMGDIRVMQRDYARALGYFKEVLEHHPSSPYFAQSRFKLGLCHFELTEYDLAIANLEDRSRISDPAQLRRSSEMLSAAYLAKKNYPAAMKELLILGDTAQNDKQKAGYRERVREIVEKNLTEEDLRTLAAGKAFPADQAQLRLAGILIGQRSYREAVEVSRAFLAAFPNHPERMRGEMLLNEATYNMTAPRYHIGALLPQSGQLAFFGARVLKGIQLAVHTYNLQEPENRVELIARDTEGSPQKTVAAYNELAQTANIVAAIGPLLTKEAEALVPHLEKQKVPVITPAASGDSLGRLSPWLFRNALTNTAQAAAAAQLAAALRLNRVVILHPDDAYGRDLARLFTREIAQKAEILASLAYPSDVKDFGPYIRKVMEIDLRSRKIPIPEDDAERKKLFSEYIPAFEGLYLPGHAEKVGLLIPQLAYYNIKGLTMIGSNNWHSKDLLARADRYAEGAIFINGYFPESLDPVIKPVLDAYRSAYQEEPDLLAAQAYDAAMMVLKFIKERKDTPQAVRDGLLDLKNYPGISGETTFPGTGEAQKKLFFIEVRNGEFTAYTGEK